jgi:hypothetical protein
MDLKNQGFTIIGYCRKSTQQTTIPKRIKSLQETIDHLYERPFAQFVFVLPYNDTTQPIIDRDINCDMKILNKLSNIHGSSKRKSITTIMKKDRYIYYTL